jgi:hypothetical protein
VSAGKNAQPDYIHILLDRGIDDHLRSLAQTGVHHFEARIPQPVGDHLGPAVVSVQSGLGHENPDFLILLHDFISFHGKTAESKERRAKSRELRAESKDEGA